MYPFTTRKMLLQFIAALVIVLLFCLLPLFGLTQRVENKEFRAEYVTYAQGHIVLSVESKVKNSCDLDIQAVWDLTGDSLLRFHGREKRQVMLPFHGGDVKVKLMTAVACGDTINGKCLTLSMTALPLRDGPPLRPPVSSIPAGRVRIVAVLGNYWTEMPEAEFQRRRDQFRIGYFILRAGKPKEVIL